MRLRHRLLLLFGTFAVVPLVAMGFFDYARSLRHLEAVLSAQTRNIADRAGQELKDRLDLQESDLYLLSRNAETQRFLRMLANGAATPETSAARRSLERYWQELWQSMHFGYERLALVDHTGQTQMVLGATSDVAFDPRMLRLPAAPGLVRNVVDIETRAALGKLEYTVLTADLVRGTVFRSVFGGQGRTFIVDRQARRILLEPSANTAGPREVPFSIDLLAPDRGTFSYGDSTGRRVASFVSFAEPPWTLLVTASLDEFAGPFVRMRLFDLTVLLAVVIAVSLGFFVLLRRATASLDRITIAADRVGRGDFNPELPAPGSDEVGRLSAAFGLMTARVREMIAQVEASRQMGVLGRFAAELSHEIRNPLTAIKINLQGLERDARDGRIPPDSNRAVVMALREIRRLDLALKTALKTGRPPAEPRVFHVHRVLQESIDLVRPQGAEHGVTVNASLTAVEDELSGDADAMRGAVLNILLNAVDAMAAGGNVCVETTNTVHDSTPAIAIRIRDDGPGIPPEIRDRVFRPFFTTKSEGTGLGLSVALQTAHAHGGTLTLGDPGSGGTEVLLVLPLQPHHAPVPS